MKLFDSTLETQTAGKFIKQSALRPAFEELTPEAETQSYKLPKIEVSIIKTEVLLFVLFDTSSSTATDSLTAIKEGIAGNFYTYQPLALERIMRQDYLWQHTCFECFISPDSQPQRPYLEVNLAPSGQFNLYYFDNYRTPNTMPPRRLPVEALQYGRDINFFNEPIDCQTVFWQTATDDMRQALQTIETVIVKKPLQNRLGMIFRIDALNRLFNRHNNSFAINPCFVYQQPSDERISYWAIQHATPADFHDKSIWQVL